MSLRTDTDTQQRESQADIDSLSESSKTSNCRIVEIRAAPTQQREAEKAVEDSHRKREDAELCHSVEVKQLKPRHSDALSSGGGDVDREAETRAVQQQISPENRALSGRDAEVAGLVDEEMAVLRQKILQKNQQLLQKEEEVEDLHQQLDHLKKSHTAVVESLEGIIGVLGDQVKYLNMQFPKELSPFPKKSKIKFQKCADIPSAKVCAQAVVIGGIVYVGGGYTLSLCVDNRYLIHGYSPTEDKWLTLPPAPVYFFGMGELKGQLVIVGGKTSPGDVTGKVYTFDNSSQKWKESIPPMPTAHESPAVFSQPSCLTVVGGRDEYWIDLSDVDIFLPHISQWHKASPAPSRLSPMTTTVIHNKCFLAECQSSNLYQLSVSVHHQTTSGSSESFKVSTEWEYVPDIPYRTCVLGSFNGCLLTLGGSDRGKIIKTIVAFSPITNSWKTVGELPEPRDYSTTVLLQTGELLVVGGADKPFGLLGNAQVRIVDDWDGSCSKSVWKVKNVL